MKRWLRRTELASTAECGRETWELVDNGAVQASHDLDVRYGKPLDVVRLKGQSIDDVRTYAEFLDKAAARLYAEGMPSIHVAACPCCGYPSEKGKAGARIFGIEYNRCGRCGHAYVLRQPTREVLNQVFTESEEHSSTYTDHAAIELRLREIIGPKLDWTIAAFRSALGREPGSCLDVGAGGGHFVAGASRRGLQAAGYELSDSSRRFAKAAFGIDLSSRDFLTGQDGGEYDVITFWGLLEYTPEPARFIAAARRRLSPEGGLLVLEVPRYECLGTAIQSCFPASVARHLDPTSHVNCFTDASIAFLLHEQGFRPLAAWYFGMDAYEVLSQLALARNDANLLRDLAGIIPALQAQLDQSRCCDDIIVAAVPA